VQRGFIVDEEEAAGRDAGSDAASDSSSDDDIYNEVGRKRQRRKRLRQGGTQADVEDLELVMEAQGVSADALAPLAKRSRMGDGGEGAGTGVDGSSAAAGQAAVQDGAAGAEVGGGGEDGAAAGGGGGGGDDDYDSEGMDEFIDDDGVGGAAGGQLPVRSAAARDAASSALLASVDPAMMADFDDVFGPGMAGMFDAVTLAGGESAGLPHLDDDVAGAELGSLSALFGDDAAGGGSDDEAAAAAAAAASTRRQAAARRAAAKLDRVEAAVHLMTPMDVAVREQDEPERMQLLLRARILRQQLLEKSQGHLLREGDAGGEPSFLATVANHASVSGLQARVEWIALRLLASPQRDVLSPDVELPATVTTVTGLTVPGADGRRRALEVEDVSPMVTHVLDFVYQHHLDVPTIWYHRRDYFLPGVSLGVVWSILDLDEAWSRLTDAKLAVGRLGARGQTLGLLSPALFDQALDGVRRATSERTVSDVLEWLRLSLIAAAGERGVRLDVSALSRGGVSAVEAALAPTVAAGTTAPSSRTAIPDTLDDLADLFGDSLDATAMATSGEAGAGTGGREGGGALGAADRRSLVAAGVAGVASRNDLYSVAVAAARPVLAAVFMPPHQLAENAMAGRATHAVPATLADGGVPAPAGAPTLAAVATACIDPHDLADLPAVLAAAQVAAARQIAHEPYLRARLRARLLASMTLEVQATERGVRDIDVTSPFYGIHFLRKRLDAVPEVTTTLDYARRHAEAGNDWYALPDHVQGLDAQVVDEDFPSSLIDLYPTPLGSDVGFAMGWGSGCGTDRVGYADGRATRLPARVGGFAQWALIAKAEADGLITVALHVDEATLRETFHTLAALYLSPEGVLALIQGGGAADATHLPGTDVPGLGAADALRRAALATAVTVTAVEDAKAYARAALTRAAQEALAGEYASALRRRLLQAPPQPPPHPLRKRKRKDDARGGEAEGDGEAAGFYPVERMPGQPVRCRLMAVGVGRPGLDSAAPGAGMEVAVMLDPRGEVIESLILPPRRDECEVVMGRFMFRHAPDLVAVSAGAGERSRTMRDTVMAAALVAEELVRTARHKYRARKELAALKERRSEYEKRHGRKGRDKKGEGDGEGSPPRDPALNFTDAMWQAAHDEQAMGDGLEPFAVHWTSGRWKHLRPRAPAWQEEEVVQMDGRKARVRKPLERDSTLPVVWVEDEWARVFATSQRAKDEFPDLTATARYTVSVGRYAQDPLAEVAYLWARRGRMDAPGVTAAMAAGVASIPAELEAVRLHPLQTQVPSHLLFAAAERAMVEAVNAVGVDLLLIAGRRHLQPLLQFVSGLGPRKSNMALTALRSAAGTVTQRAHLTTASVLTSRVFHNAAAFLRIRPPAACMCAVYTLEAEDIGNQPRIDAKEAPRRASGARRGDGGRRGGKSSDADDDDEDEGSTGSDDDDGAGAGKQRDRDGEALAERLPTDLDVEEALRHTRHRLEDGTSARVASRPAFAAVARRLWSADAERFNPLDATRIHPDHYDYAWLMCKAVCDDLRWTGPLTASAEGHFERATPMLYARGVRTVTAFLQNQVTAALHGTAITDWNPVTGMVVGRDGRDGRPLDPDDVLVQTDFALWGQMESAKLGRPVSVTVVHAHAELRLPFRDPRTPHALPTTDAFFRMMTGETAASLYPGVVVNVRVIKPLAAGLRVRLDNGLSGWISRTSLPPLPPSATVEYTYPMGTALAAKIINVNRVGQSVDLEALPPLTWEADDNLIKRHISKAPIVDYQFEHAAAVAAAIALTRKALEETRKAIMAQGGAAGAAAAALGGTGRAVRAITHPCFHDVTSAQAEAMLADRPLYTAIFRPSSKGISNLTVTWKLFEPRHCVHINVDEQDKEGLAPNALGRKLVIDGMFRYGDLDEVLARHLDPMAKHHANMRRSDKYRDWTPDEVDAKLQAELAANPKRIAYFVSPDLKHVGMYRLSYLTRVKEPVRHELVIVVPGGYKWRGTVLPSVRHFFDHFKQTGMQAPPRPAGSAAAAAPVAAAPSGYSYSSAPYSDPRPSTGYSSTGYGSSGGGSAGGSAYNGYGGSGAAGAGGYYR